MTPSCPACGQPFTPTGRRRWCSDTCKQAAWRRRRMPAVPAPPVPPKGCRRAMTVYECSQCGLRALGIFSSPWVLEAGWRCDGRKRCKAFGAGVARLEAGYRCVPRLAL